MHSGKWTDAAWNAATPVFDKITAHPFITEMMDGTLPMDKFMYYIRQDSLYMKHYSEVMSFMADRIPEPEISSLFRKLAEDNIEAEKEMHKFFVSPGTDSAGSEMLSDEKMSPTCLLLVSHLRMQAASPSLEVAMASVLPCFLVYQRTGEHIFRGCRREGNPYMKWIETYAADEFDTSVSALMSICDNMAASCPGQADAMTEAFVMGTKMEWMFWDAAYRMEKWKI